MNRRRPVRSTLSGFSRVEFSLLTSALSVVAFSCGTAVGAQTIDGNLSSVGTWEAAGTQKSPVTALDGKTLRSPLLVPSASVRFVDTRTAPAPAAPASSVHVTNSATAPLPKIAIDPRVKVSNDADAPLPPAPANTKVELIVGSTYVSGHANALASEVAIIDGSRLISAGGDVLASNVEVIDGSSIVRPGRSEPDRWPVLAHGDAQKNG